MDPVNINQFDSVIQIYVAGSGNRFRTFVRVYRGGAGGEFYPVSYQGFCKV